MGTQQGKGAESESGPQADVEAAELLARAEWPEAGAESLSRAGLYRQHVAREPGCLFRAGAQCGYGTQRLHSLLRSQLVSLVSRFGKTLLGLTFSGDVQDYVRDLSDEKTYGTLNEVAVMTRLFRRDIIVVDSVNGPNFSFCKNYGKPIYLFHQSKIQHFDILLPIEHVEISALCQSLIYTSIYKGVFSMKDVEIETARMFPETPKMATHRKPAGDSGTNGVASDDKVSGKLELQPCNAKKHPRKEPLKNFQPKYDITKHNNKNVFVLSTPLFSYKVARGLSPYIYKNLDFDIWVEQKREEEMALRFHDGLTLQVGVKCLCKLDPNQDPPYNCYIQIMIPDGPCEVFIEELGEKKTVDYKQLVPLPPAEAKSWYTPIKRGNGKFSRRFNNQKRKKSIVPVQDLSKFMQNKNNKVYFKTRVIENKFENNVKDSNNNSVVAESESFASTCSAVEWENTENEEIETDYSCLKKYTRIDYYTFKPYPVDYITMPLTTEQNGSGSSVNRESSGSSRQAMPFTFPVPTTSTSNGSPLLQFPASNETNGPPSPYVTSTSPITNPPVLYQTTAGLMCPSNSPYSSMPIYCVPPIPIPSIRPTGPMTLQYPPRQPMIPYGVNLSVSRSMNQNGSDLPLTDMPTLRFFFNLGVEWMQTFGGYWPPPPLTGPPVTPNNNYFYQGPTTPNQLALDLQHGLNLDDSHPNSGPDNSKQYNNGKRYGDYRGGRGRGGHNQTYKRNDGPSDRNNYKNSNNRGPNNYANNKKGNHKNYNENGNSHEKKDHSPEHENNSRDSPSTPLAPYINFPPPSYYRMPFYPIDGDGSLGSNGYTNFIPFSSGPEDGAATMMDGGFMAPPPHYMPYIPPPPPPQMFYPPSTVSTYYPPNSSDSTNGKNGNHM